MKFLGLKKWFSYLEKVGSRALEEISVQVHNINSSILLRWQMDSEEWTLIGGFPRAEYRASPLLTWLGSGDSLRVWSSASYQQLSSGRDESRNALTLGGGGYHEQGKDYRSQRYLDLRGLNILQRLALPIDSKYTLPGCSPRPTAVAGCHACYGRSPGLCWN